MWLPRWIKRIVFGNHPSPKTTLEFMTTGGLRALKTRTSSPPPILIFGISDGEQVFVRCVTRPDLDPDLAQELSLHLAETAHQFLDDDEGSP